MSIQNPDRLFSPIQCVFKVRQIAADSWWVYRYEIVRGGELSRRSRVVFFGQSEADVEAWLGSQRKTTLFCQMDDV